MIEIPEATLINTDKLKVDGDNPNKMTPKQLERLKSSVTKYGFIVPIITNKDLLVADGEQRLTTAHALNMKQVPVIRLPIEDVDRRLLRQVLNKLRGEHELLADAYEFERIIKAGHEDDLKQLLDLSDSHLERYLAEIREPKDEDYEVPEIDKVQTDIKRGDVFQLHMHRLMCGDATVKADVSKLMNGEKADMVFTDPPYRLKSESFGHSGEEKYESVDFDKVFPYNAWMPNVDDATKDDANILIFEYWNNVVPLWEEMSKHFRIKNMIIWHALNRWNHANRRFINRYDIVLYGVKGKYYFDQKGFHNRLDDILGVPVNTTRKTGQSVVKGTKPLEFLTPYIQILSCNPHIVLDLFGGSGSTLIACEQTGRHCYMMEIDPRYCQIIINRWQQYTGKKAVKIGEGE